jgi:thiamine kinase-like enzyme
MTNTSFTFQAGQQVYVVRLPGVGTEQLIDREAERQIYLALADTGITDELLAMDNTGRRVAVFYSDARQADPLDDSDLAASMRIVRNVHQMELPLERRFNIDGMITQYEELCSTVAPISYPGIAESRQRVAELQRFRDVLAVPEVYCHGDSAPTNVLILGNGDVKLIDWEYSGRSDPIMDVAMYGIFSYFDQVRLDLSLQLYLDREPTANETARLYLYAALSGFLWSLWAHYKEQMGQDFGSYGLDQYSYLPRYYSQLASGDLMARAAQTAGNAGAAN